jgi:predicted DNA-binding antitoxin AbrB/MazE fold protein
MQAEAVMETFTVQAVYEKGVLRPNKKLDLPEHSLVEVRVKVAPAPGKKTEFAALLGIWETTDGLDLEKSLAGVRQKSKAKINRLAKALK